MTAMLLKSKNAADLKPFASMAKRFGISVEYVQNEKPKKKNSEVWQKFRDAMEGAAEEAGFKNEQDVVEYCKQIRREMWEKHYANNA